MKFAYSVHVRCHCAGPDAKPLGQECPRLWRKDKSWNSRHGSAGFACRVPTSGGIKPVKRFGFTSKGDAQAAAEAVGKLLDLAGADSAARAKIGDMIAAAKRGAPLPAADDIRRRLGLGLDPANPGVTVAEWLDTWLAGKRRTRRPSAVCSYESHIRVWLKPALGHVPLERVSTAHIEDLFATIGRFNSELERQRADGRALIEIEGDTRGQPRICGPSTQRRIFATLRVALNAAVKQHKITWNPCVGVEMEPENPAEAKRWTPAEAARFIACVADDPLGLLYRIAVLRGARRGELAGLRWADVNLDTGVLTVVSTILQLGGTLIIGGKPKTKAGERWIFLDAETAEMLRQWRRAWLAMRMRAGAAWEDSGDLVFCQADGRPWNPDHISRRFRRLSADAGVPVIKLHEARHSAISLMRDAGVDKTIRMREAGQSDAEVADRYTHVLIDAHLAAAEQVAALVRAAGGAS
jgi:integrase